MQNPTCLKETHQLISLSSQSQTIPRNTASMAHSDSILYQQQQHHCCRVTDDASCSAVIGDRNVLCMKTDHHTSLSTSPALHDSMCNSHEIQDKMCGPYTPNSTAVPAQNSPPAQT
jgi:type VI protein secretion system component Hcp